MAAMAGTLFIVGADMIKWSDVTHYSLVRSELVIYLCTFIGILFFGLAVGIEIAVFLSVSVFLVRISQLDIKEEVSSTGAVLKVKGALFYASVANLTEKFQGAAGKDLTVDLQYTTHIDQSAVDFFNREAKKMAEKHTRLTLVINDKQRQFLEKLGASNSIELVLI